MEHSNSRTFQGLSRAWNFFFKIQGLSRTSQGPYEPCMLREIGPGGAFVLAIWGKRGCVGGQR